VACAREDFIGAPWKAVGPPSGGGGSEKKRPRQTLEPFVIGRPWRIRTADQRIKSPLLYQLS
jgi:hypothetical protein